MEGGRNCRATRRCGPLTLGKGERLIRDGGRRTGDNRVRDGGALMFEKFGGFSKLYRPKDCVRYQLI